MRKQLLLLSISGAIILTLVTGSTYKYIMNYLHLNELNIFETEIERIIKTEFLDRYINQIEKVKSGENQYNRYFMYYSVTENKNILKQLEVQTKVASKQLKDSRSVVLSYVNEEKVNDALINRQLVTKEYVWDDQMKSLNYSGEIKELSEILLAENRNESNFKDIVNSEADRLALNRVLQEQVLLTHSNSQSELDDGTLDQVLTNNSLTEDNKLTFLPQSLEIVFDKDIIGVKKINVSYEKIAPFIDPAVVDLAVPKEEVDIEKKANYVALTFDDGPNDTSTIKLLDTLEKENIKATFFVLGQMVDKNPEVAKKIVQQGHEVGSHSYTHPDLTTLPNHQVKEEVLKTDKAVFNATGVLPKIFRPPYGAVNEAVAQTVAMPIIQWNVDSEDWKLKNKDLIVNKVINIVDSGSIILLHDIHETSLDSVPEIVSHLKSSGYEFVTISELFSHNKKPLNQYFSLEDHREIN